MQTKEIEKTIPFFISTKRNLEMKIFAVREIKTERVAGKENSRKKKQFDLLFFVGRKSGKTFGAKPRKRDLYSDVIRPKVRVPKRSARSFIQ